MKNTIRIWDELGFSFDAVATGFVVSGEQAGIIGDFWATAGGNHEYFAAGSNPGGTDFFEVSLF